MLDEDAVTLYESWGLEWDEDDQPVAVHRQTVTHRDLIKREYVWKEDA